jgi:hypothetical protein
MLLLIGSIVFRRVKFIRLFTFAGNGGKLNHKLVWIKLKRLTLLVIEPAVKEKI